MQLVAYGAQDIYLTGNPQITFFKVVYRRHTNFSMETIDQTINGSPTTNGSSTVTISRNGDLVHKVYVTLAATSTTEGSDIVSEVELEIGGQRIDRHYKEWMQIWNELSTPESKAIGLKAMQGDVGTRGTTGVSMLQVPLQFWFCRNPGLALPLIALQYHEVKLKFTWGGTTDPASSKVLCDYIYLDTDERRRFAQVSHEYLIEQLQKQSADESGSVKLNFNHPVKELIWTSAATNAYGTAQLKLNGHDRFSAQEEEYFQLRQPFDFHTAIPAQNLPTNAFASARAGTTSYTELLVSSIDGPVVSLNAAAAAGATKQMVAVTADDGALDGSDGGAEGVVYGFHDADLATVFVVGNLYLITTRYNTTTNVKQSTIVKCTSVASPTAARTADSTLAASTTLTTTGGSAAGVFTPGADTIGVTFDKVIFNNGVTAAVNATAATQLTVDSIIEIADAGCRTSQMTKKINVYSFALKPEEHQPSGTCNFSRIDTAKLDTNAALGTGDNIYAVNYNVLRIMSGMGGLAYSN